MTAPPGGEISKILRGGTSKHGLSLEPGTILSPTPAAASALLTNHYGWLFQALLSPNSQVLSLSEILAMTAVSNLQAQVRVALIFHGCGD